MHYAIVRAALQRDLFAVCMTTWLTNSFPLSPLPDDKVGHPAGECRRPTVGWERKAGALIIYRKIRHASACSG